MFVTVYCAPFGETEERGAFLPSVRPGEGPIMDELEAGKQKFIELVKAIDSGVAVVIPSAPSNSVFLISLSRGSSRKFITVSEDDLVDLTSDDLIRDEVQDRVQETISELKS